MTCGAGVTTYTFDANGNQRLVQSPNGGIRTNTWNYENQRTLVQLASGARVTMGYTAKSRRIRKEG